MNVRLYFCLFHNKSLNLKSLGFFVFLLCLKIIIYENFVTSKHTLVVKNIVHQRDLLVHLIVPLFVHSVFILII